MGAGAPLTRGGVILLLESGFLSIAIPLRLAPAARLDLISVVMLCRGDRLARRPPPATCPVREIARIGRLAKLDDISRPNIMLDTRRAVPPSP